MYLKDRAQAEVTHLHVGQRVVSCVGPACGVCPQCVNSYMDHGDLAFAEANGITDEQAALVEPATVTFHAVRRTHQALGAFVVVQGAGPIGLLTAQNARHAGAGRVVVEPSEARREIAKILGFTEIFEPGDDFSKFVFDSSDGLGADVLYECTGAASLFQASAELVRRGGTLSLLGYPTTSSEVSYPDWQSRELTVIGSLAYTHDDFLGSMRAIASGDVDVTRLHTATVGLTDLGALLDELDSGSSTQTKALVDPRR